MTTTPSTRQNLTTRQQRIFDALKDEKRPLTAYELIDRVSTDTVWAPPTIYRALRRLMDQGLVHRLESRNAFLACTISHQKNEWVAFTVCDRCNAAEEFIDDELASRLKARAQQKRFHVLETTLELRGLCPLCASE